MGKTKYYQHQKGSDAKYNMQTDPPHEESYMFHWHQEPRYEYTSCRQLNHNISNAETLLFRLIAVQMPEKKKAH